jgi:hypothetical protein
MPASRTFLHCPSCHAKDGTGRSGRAVYRCAICEAFSCDKCKLIVNYVPRCPHCTTEIEGQKVGRRGSGVLSCRGAIRNTRDPVSLPIKCENPQCNVRTGFTRGSMKIEYEVREQIGTLEVEQIPRRRITTWECSNCHAIMEMCEKLETFTKDEPEPDFLATVSNSTL